MGINKFNPNKRCPCVYYRMDGDSGDPEPDVVQGFDLANYGTMGSNTGHVGGTPSARTHIEGNSVYGNYLHRANAEKIFAIQRGGTVAGWFRANRQTSSPFSYPILMGNCGIYKGTENEQIGDNTEWTLWPLLLGGSSPSSSNGVEFNIPEEDYHWDGDLMDWVGYVYSLNITAGDFGAEANSDEWIFMAGRVKSDLSLMTVTMGLTGGAIGHKSLAMINDPPRQHIPTNSMYFQGMQSFDGNEYLFDEWGFYCCYLSDADIAWLYNGGAGRQVR